MKRTLALLLAFVLVIGATVAGTLAYLTDTSKEVKNTFTIGKVGIDLHETEVGSDTISYGNTYALIPGTTYEKDPVVSVDEGSEDCYLFVKFIGPDPKPEWLDYTTTLDSTNGWTPVAGETNVWYREVNKTDTTRSWKLLVDDEVTVTDQLTQDNMPAANATPTLTFTAYACQRANLSVTEAWAQVKDLDPEA
ncbi:MAG: SipW-dependent-type signal peptide-containing protein [Eubacteriales bacterium]|nr:SipW-dependent-type signal peptide-containing protein [Eubacteriales bacterium]